MDLEVSVSYGKGGTGDMFQIDSVRDAETGDDLTTSRAIDVARHFCDRADLGDYLREVLGSSLSFTIEGEDGGSE